MERLESYLSENHIKEKDEQRSVTELIEKVIPIYEKLYKGKGWGYELLIQPDYVSTSTTAMIAFSMAVLMSGKLDLVPDKTEEVFIKVNNDKKKLYDKLFDESLDLLLKEFKNAKNKDENSGEKKEYAFYSNTYGENDPLTLMWTRYLVDNNKTKADIVTPDILDKFNEKCIERVTYIFKKLYNDKKHVEYTSQINKDHIFPLLKIVQLYYVMTDSLNSIKEKEFWAKEENEKKEEKQNYSDYVDGVRNILCNRLHYHLSLASIENSNFDAAELVFSLEGMLLLDPNRDYFDQNLLDKVFQVVNERQKISLYWRPLKPFVSNKQGLALLPLSVEIAMSLFRICRLLESRGEELFSKNYEMFKKYTDWLKTRVTVKHCNKKCGECRTKEENSSMEPCDGKNYYGWCSEHIYEPSEIHSWETSQVIVYLVNFIYMLQKHIAYKSFKFADFSTKYYVKNETEWEKFIEKEPVSIEGFEVYKKIGENYINTNNCYSMLLYGPPGTGKSTIAEKIAEAKGWPLVTITPSNFIANGADQVETKAKSIFKVLEEQDKMVVLFDEIDRLILDRDSASYSEQGDLFQFMTPSMLVKLKDLRSKKKIIFIIATNYEERIDLAIKRKGRIDEHYLVLPPDKKGRERLYNEFIKECDEDNHISNKLKDHLKNYVLKKTALFTFIEFQQLCKEIKKKWTDIFEVEEEVEKNIEKKLNENFQKPAITLMSYKGKLGITNDEKNVQKPIKEFLSLVYLKAETYDGIMDTCEVFDKNELNLLVKFLGSKEMLGNESKGEFKDNLSMIFEGKPALEGKLNEYIHKGMTEKILAVLEKVKI